MMLDDWISTSRTTKEHLRRFDGMEGGEDLEQLVLIELPGWLAGVTPAAFEAYGLTQAADEDSMGDVSR
jgi:hypothetical protein